MKQLQNVPKQRILTAALLLALANPVTAQVAAADAKATSGAGTSGQAVAPPGTTEEAAKSAEAQKADETKTLDTVVVAGIRGSLNQSMEIKRDAVGVVDAISAEDIGKFPDTNLAESLQRITGISIERRDGEGAQITARGFGPQFNTVTLNGRQIPGADAFGAPGQTPIGGVDVGTRAFNFAQLASEAITGLEVFKTSRANAPSGGIGATIDIKTDKPFNHDGIVASLGANAVVDQSQPFGTDITPELSGIYSYTNDDKTWGVGLSASYQKRHGGSVQSTVNAWNQQHWTGSDIALRPDATVSNAPEIGQLYGLPNDIRYAFADFERERINAQAIVQFKPSDSVTLALDYTYSTNEITEKRGEQTMWLQRANSFTDLTFDTGQAVATPTYLRDIPNGGKDFGYEQQTNEQKYELKSLGFNALWQVTDDFSLSFDGHNSKTSSSPNDDTTGGGATYFSMAGTNNCTNGPNCGGGWGQEFFFNSGLPIAARTWYPTASDQVAGTNGTLNPDFTEAELGSQVLRIFAQKQETEIKEGRIDGTWQFDNGRFQFGIDSSNTTMNRQTSSTYNPLGDWGVANAGDEPGMVALMHAISITGLFNDYNADGAAPGAWTGDADQLALWAAQAYPGTSSVVNPNLDADNEVEEDTQAAYIQVEFQGELGGMTTNTRVGVRYERTDVTSTSSVAIPTDLEWQANNDFQLLRSTDQAPFSEKTSYSYILPNLDFDINFTDSLKGRASFGTTIARAPYNSLIAGPTPGTPTGSILVNPSSRAGGSANNPSLLPLESNNLDLAVEWYFADTSYVSATYWDKRVSNFLGTSVTRQSLYGLTDPTSGPDAQAALSFLQSQACLNQVTAAGNDTVACSANDTSLFAALALLRNASETGGLAAYNGSSAQSLAMETNYDLVGEADDPLYMFDVNGPVNQNTSNISGWELGGQYFLGDTGFGFFANYTIVNGDVKFDDTVIDRDQFALLGLSDTANFVFIYEKYGWSARLAYNWRDEYLISANQDGSNRNPYYVEPYSQWDLNVSYTFNDNWSVGLQAINLTGEDVRWHGRSEKQMIKLVDQDSRYTFGFRWNF
jgi:TonB-dependent receptor